MKPLIVILLVSIGMTCYAQQEENENEKYRRDGFLGGYVVQNTDVNNPQSYGVNAGDVILTHKGRLVLTEFDRAQVKEDLTKGRLEKYSILKSDKKNRKSKKLERQ